MQWKEPANPSHYLPLIPHKNYFMDVYLCKVERLAGFIVLINTPYLPFLLNILRPENLLPPRQIYWANTKYNLQCIFLMKTGFDLLKYSQAFWVQCHGITVSFSMHVRYLLKKERKIGAARSFAGISVLQKEETVKKAVYHILKKNARNSSEVDGTR